MADAVAFYRDADAYDAFTDELAVGDPFDPAWPDIPLRLRPFSAKPTAERPRARAGEPLPPVRAVGHPNDKSRPGSGPDGS